MQLPSYDITIFQRLTRKTSVRLTAISLGVMLIVATIFLFQRFWRLSSQGSDFAYSYEITRSIIVFGAMAILTPFIFRTARWSQAKPRLVLPISLVGLVIYTLSYFLIVQVLLYQLPGGPEEFIPFRNVKKLTANFGYVIVLFYLAIYLVSYFLSKTKQDETGSPVQESLTIRKNGITQEIALTHIQYITTYDHYLKLHTANGFELLRQTLKETKAQLSGSFIQIHRTAIANINHIDSTNSRDGKLKLTMRDGNKLIVSRSLKKEVLHALNDHSRTNLTLHD